MRDYAETTFIPKSFDGDAPLTVAELIAKLSELPPNMPVFTEGCDCYGNAADVSVQQQANQAKDYVLITRTK